MLRNRDHSRLVTRVGRFLDEWLDHQPEPRGQVLSGEAGVRLRRDPDTTVGVDVVYVSAEMVSRPLPGTSSVEGVPTLALEILSPNDRHQDVVEKIDTYLDAGVPIVWLINPNHRTVNIFRPGAEPEMVNIREEPTAQPQLPGFRAPVAQLFR